MEENKKPRPARRVGRPALEVPKTRKDYYVPTGQPRGRRWPKKEEQQPKPIKEMKIDPQKPTKPDSTRQEATVKAFQAPEGKRLVKVDNKTYKYI